MKKLIIAFSVISILCSMPIVAQNFQGVAIYEVNSGSGGFTITSTTMNPQQMAKMEELMKKSNTETFILNFTKSESIYEKEQKLDAPKSSGKVSSFTAGKDSKLYKNVKDKLQLEEEDFMDREFLVSDSLKNWNWQLTSETKKIGDYTCYKAISIKKVTAREMEEYEKDKAAELAGKTAFFISEEPTDKIITAWYTPEIPIAQGPGYFWGLPGLILEASFDKTLILCSKVVLNPKANYSMKLPKNGTKVTKTEYDKIVEDKLESMKDSNGVIQIRIEE